MGNEVRALAEGERVIVTHTDLDGVASAALIIKALGRVDRIYFTQPHQLHSALCRVPNSCELFIADLGINDSTLDKVLRELRRITSSGGRVRWFDHHVWRCEWINAIINIGVELHVDTSTCGAGVVAKYLPINDSWANELVRAACSVDLWLFNDWRGNYLARYVGYREGGAWRERIARELASADELISEEVERVAEEMIDRELKLYSKVLKGAKVSRVAGYRIAYYLKPRTEHVTSYIGNLLLSRFNADIAVICREGSLSLRSREVDVVGIARALGGGGHPRAAGAPAKPPLYVRLLAKIGVKSPLLNWCFRRVAGVVAGLET